MRKSQNWSERAEAYLRSVLESNAAEVAEDLILHDHDCPARLRAVELLDLCGQSPEAYLVWWRSL